jgi:hypothetical protein
MTKIDKRRVAIFKRIMKNKNIELDLKDRELLDILNSAILPNSLSFNAVRHSIFWHFSLTNNRERFEEMRIFLEKTIYFFKSLTRIEKLVLSFSLFKGFKSSARKDLWRFLTTPFDPLDNNRYDSAKRIVSFDKFLNIYTFAKKQQRQGEKNGQPIKF